MFLYLYFSRLRPVMQPDGRLVATNVRWILHVLTKPVFFQLLCIPKSIQVEMGLTLVLKSIAPVGMESVLRYYILPTPQKAVAIYIAVKMMMICLLLGGKKANFISWFCLFEAGDTVAFVTTVHFG